MVGKPFIAIILAMSLIQGITLKEKQKVPRLKYTKTGRYLDNPESITYFLAKHNSEGFPNELFYRSLEDEPRQNANPSIEMDLMMEALNSPEAQRSLEEAALDYFADVLDEPEAHAAVEYSGRDHRALCSYSWLSWVPWLGCPSEQRGNTGEQLPSSQLHAQCVEPQAINYHAVIV